MTSSITDAVEDLGHEPGADPLDLVRARRLAGEHRARSAGSTATTWKLGPALLEHLADAGDRAAGADAGDQRVDLAVEVAPDLLRRRPAVDLGVGGVGELLRHERAALGDDLLGERIASAMPAERRGLVHLGAVGAQQLACARGSCPRAGSGRARSRAPRTPSPARSRCCRWSARRSSRRARARRRARPRRSSPPRSGP